VIARDPRDLALVFRLLSEVGAGDPAAGWGPAVPLRVGLCPDLVTVALSTSVQAVFESAQQVLKDLGAAILEVRLPEAGLIEQAFSATQRAEALHTHMTRGLFPARAGEYGADVRARLELAQNVDLRQYLDAQRDREEIRAGFRRLFHEVDVLLTPASPVAPPAEDVEQVEHQGGRAPLRALIMPFMVPQNLAGLPAVAVRAGFDDQGLPVSVQLSGAPGADRLVLGHAASFHAATAATQERWPVLMPPASPRPG
jgi:aspartyl-tRNA(Asn)/glutamyl-tRNA(Gln) amidotransferase subunit A